MVNGKLVAYPTPQPNGQLTNPTVAVIGREVGTGRIALCTAQRFGNRYGSARYSIGDAPDAPAAGQASRLGSGLSAGQYTVNFGLYGPGVSSGRLVDSKERPVYARNGAFIAVSDVQDADANVVALDAAGNPIANTPG